MRARGREGTVGAGAEASTPARCTTSIVCTPKQHPPACPKPPCLAAVWQPFEDGGIKAGAGAGAGAEVALWYIAENCERSMRHVN